MPRAFSTDYLAGGMRANRFFARGFGDPDDRCSRVAAAARRGIATELHAELSRQMDALACSEAQRTQLAALAQPGTVVVATGQQVGLFLGPLYTLYKAATAIVVARRLAVETGRRCVPLFWLQTEDHDFAEIATCFTPLRSGELLRLTLKDDGPDRCSVAHRMLGAQVESLLDQLESGLSDQPHAAEVLELLRAHYRPGCSVARAFAGTLSTLFAAEGLLVFNPRCDVAARLVRPVIERALTQSRRIDEALLRQNQALAEAGYNEQIQLRPGYPLAFFHQGDERGPRMRVPFEEEHLRILDAQPMRFSTSALLRPIVQDTLFPTAVYVGGPAEVSYFAQLPPLYELYGMEPPLLAERAHFDLVPLPIRRLKEEAPSPPAGEGAPNATWLAEFEQRLDALSHRTPSLGRNVERTRGSVRHAFGRLVRKYERDSLERDRVAADRRRRLETWLRPEGHLQERVHCFAAFAARAGPAELRQKIIDAIDPFDPSMREIDL